MTNSVQDHGLLFMNTQINEAQGNLGLLMRGKKLNVSEWKDRQSEDDGREDVLKVRQQRVTGRDTA